MYVELSITPSIGVAMTLNSTVLALFVSSTRSHPLLTPTVVLSCSVHGYMARKPVCVKGMAKPNRNEREMFQLSFDSITSAPCMVANLPTLRSRPFPTGARYSTKASGSSIWLVVTPSPPVTLPTTSASVPNMSSVLNPTGLLASTGFSRVSWALLIMNPFERVSNTRSEFTLVCGSFRLYVNVVSTKPLIWTPCRPLGSCRTALPSSAPAEDASDLANRSSKVPSRPFMSEISCFQTWASGLSSAKTGLALSAIPHPPSSTPVTARLRPIVLPPRLRPHHIMAAMIPHTRYSDITDTLHSCYIFSLPVARLGLHRDGPSLLLKLVGPGKPVSLALHFVNQRPLIPLQQLLQVADPLIHRPQAPGVMPAQALLQQPPPGHDLARPARQVDK